MDVNEPAGSTPNPVGEAQPTTEAPEPPRRSGRLRRIVGILGKGVVALMIVGVAIGIFGYFLATKPQVPLRDIPERTWIVRTILAKQTDVTPKLTLYGTVVAGREAELRPLVSGRIVRVGTTFSEGGIVRKDDLLIEIDDFDYRKAVEERKAQLKEARSRLVELRADLAGLVALLARDKEQMALRQTDYDRKIRLRKSGSGTQKALDDATIALNEQKARVAERESRIEATKARIDQQDAVIARLAVAVERAEKDLRETKLVAPFAGFLKDISTAVGKRVGVGDKVATLIAADQLEVEFQLSDQQYGRLVAAQVLIGKAATIIWQTGDKTFRFAARIERVSARVTAERGGVNVYAHLKNVGTETVLRPGVFVQAAINDRSYEKVFRLPDEALEALDPAPGERPVDAAARIGTSRRVFVVVDGRLQPRTVRIVGRAGNDVLVRGDLKEGDKIVSETFPEIGPGVKVETR